MKEVEIFKQQLCLKDLEIELKKCTQVKTPVENIFCGGIYLRKMSIPKDTLILGKRHRHKTCNILLKGKMSLYMGSSTPIRHIEGPVIFESKPYVRKLAYCNSDVIFINIHPTHETNVDTIERLFIITDKEYEQISGGISCRGLQQQ